MGNDTSDSTTWVAKPSEYGNAAFGEEYTSDAEGIDIEATQENYKNSRKVIFRNCKFENLSIVTTKKNFEFIDCEIRGKIRQPKDISRIKFSGKDTSIARLESYINISGGTIKRLKLKDHQFTKKFYLNREKLDGNIPEQLTINIFELDDVKFSKNFKLQNCEIEKVAKFENVDFDQIADFSGTSFRSGGNKEITIVRTNFRHLALFNNTVFHEKIVFKYVTFEDQAQFFKATFEEGIDLDYTTIKKEMNFFEARGLEGDISKEKTSQETYRIIKHNFQKLNNRIEANRFQSLELEAKNKSLSWKSDNFPFFNSEKLIYSLHKISSNFGGSWLLPLIWIFIVGTVTFLSVERESIFQGYSYLFSQVPPHQIGHYLFQAIKSSCLDILDSVIKYSYLLNRDKDFFKDHAIAFVTSKVALGYLYYQFVMAVRKDTKR